MIASRGAFSHRMPFARQISSNLTQNMPACVGSVGKAPPAGTAGLELSYVSKDGESGFPGTVEIKVVYTSPALQVRRKNLCNIYGLHFIQCNLRN